MSTSYTNHVIGIDGCKGGWCVVSMGIDKITVQVFPSLEACQDLLQESLLTLIDMPIGLSDQYVTRDVDASAKKVLGASRASSIFTPPWREAIMAKSYQEALTINRSHAGKGFSIQAWNICPKIIEVDTFLSKHLVLRDVLLESHPEITFLYLNEGTALEHKKKTSEGQEERLNIISTWLPNIRDVYVQAVEDYPRKEVAKDDIIDAMGLAIAAMLSQGYGMSTISENKKDSTGLTMNIHYVDPYGQ